MKELIIDPEFRDLIPPLTEEEYKGLEESLIQNGFDETQPVILWKDHNTVVDGHNRYEICVKHDIEPVTLEREFESRYDVIKWMLDLQLNRRSPNKKKRTYVIGRRYLVEKNEWGVYDHNKEKSAQNAHSKTAEKIGDQLSINQATVRRAAEFTEAVDRVVRVTGIRVNDLLDDKIKGDMKGIIELSKLDERSQKRVIELIKTDERDTIELSIDAFKIEERDRTFREAEERRKVMEEQLMGMKFMIVWV